MPSPNGRHSGGPLVSSQTGGMPQQTTARDGGSCSDVLGCIMVMGHARPCSQVGNAGDARVLGFEVTTDSRTLSSYI